MKRLISALLLIALVLSFLPVIPLEAKAATEGDYTFSVYRGEATIDGYTGPGGDITIPSALDGYPVTGIGMYAFDNCDSLTAVTIPNSVIIIGSYAFEECANLKSITIGDSVTSIGDEAFAFCNSLTSVTIGDSLTDIGEKAFYDCYNLTAVTIPDSVITIGKQAFFYCTGLTSVTIGNNVATIDDGAFNMTGVATVTIPTSVTKIGEVAFGIMQTLTDVYYDGTQTQWNAIEIHNNNDDLRNATMHFPEPELTEYTYTVENGKATITGYNGAGGDVVIPSTLDGYPVTAIGDEVFWGCTSMTSVEIPDTVTTIGDYAFCYCTKLTSVTIPDSVKTIGEYAFAGYLDEETGDFASSLTSVTIGSGLTTIGADAFSACGKLTSVTIPDNVTRIDFGAFCFCYNLNSVTIGKGVTAIPDFAFRACEKLTTVTIPASVTTIGEYAFSYCTELTDVYYDGTENQWNSIPVEEGNECLQNANMRFAKQEEPENAEYTYTVENGEAIITGYNGAGGDIIIPATLGGYPVTRIGEDAFYGCTSLTSVEIPDGVTKIGEGAFMSCNKLTTVNIPNSVTIIGECAFYGCSYLDGVEIPNSVTKIGVDAFAGCIHLTSVTIPDSVTAIYEGTFYYCESLTTVTIPDGVTYIGENAFANCTKLTDVYYNGTEEQWNTVSVELGNEYLQNAIVHFPEPEVPEVTDYTYTVENGEATIDGYTGVGGDVIVPAVLDGYPVTKVGQAFLQNGEIVSVTIPDSVKTIGSYAFYKCEALEEVILGNGVVDIQDSAFMESPKLKSIVIPDSLITIGQQAFEGCTGLESVQFGSGLKTIARFAFYRCSALKNVTIPDGVTAIGEMAFAYSDALETVAIGGGLTTLGATVFAHCDALKSISVSAENEHFSSDAEGFFYNKDKTTLIQAPCSYNGNYTIDDSVTTISNFAFAGCKSLTGISIPDTVTTLGESAFWDSGLTYANIGGVSKIGDYAFSNCRVLAEVNISEGVTIIGRNSFDSCFMLENIVLPEGVEKIQSGAFNWCESLKEITIPASLTSVEWSAFYWCDSLTDVYYGGTEAQWAEIGIDKTNTALISATIHCTEIPETPEVADYTYTVEIGEATITGYTGAGGNITIPAILDGYPVTEIGQSAFSGCDSLTSVVIPDSVMTIGEWVFYNCTSLTSIVIPDSVTTIGESAFKNCISLTAITIPDSVTIMGDCVFTGCTSLTSLTIPSGVSAVGNCMFTGCTSLTTVVIPNSVSRIGQAAFSDCTSLISLMIPEGVTDIWLWAFDGCTSLTSVTIPESVTVIGDGAFGGCNSLTDVYYGGSEAQWQSVSVSPDNENLQNATIHFAKHSHNYTEKIVLPTCTDGGYTIYTCTCGDSHQDNYVNALDHSFTNYVSNNDAHCIWDGTETAKCDRCEETHTRTEEGSAKGHEYETFVSAPTCEDMGFTTYVCCRCDHAYNDDWVDALGHSYTNACDTTCNRVDCGAIRAITHNYAAATCTKPKTCKACGATSGKALGHSYKSGSCTRCKYKPAGAKITTQPKNVAVSSGKTATVTIKASGTGLKYTWYYAKKGAKSYTKASSTTNSYSLKMSTSYNGTKVYCVVSDAYGNSVKSAVVTLYKGTPAKITTQPKSTTVANGKSGSITLKASGSSLKYQWYIKYKGASAFAKVGKSSKTYSFKMASKLDGAQVYCVVKDKYGIEVKSSTVTIKMPVQPKITTQPKSTKAFSGKTVKFTVKATGEGLKYQWYYAKKGSNSFKKLSAKSATYSVKVSSSVDGRKYYCLVTDQYGQTVKSSTVTLTMQKAAKILTQPKNVSVKNGKTAKVTIKAEGDGLKYTWYYLLAGETKYRKAAFTGNAFSVTMSAKYKNAKVYCAISDQYGNSVKSKVVTLKMK